MRGLRRHIKKDRIQEFLIAKGNDNRELTPRPTARFRMQNIQGDVKPSNLRSLLAHFVVKQGSTELNRNRNVIILDLDSFDGYVGDNKPRNLYPNGVLDFYLRLPKWQRNAIWSMDYGASGSELNRYLVNSVNLSNTGTVVLRTASDNYTNNNLSYINLTLNEKLKQLIVYRNQLTSIDITDNENLEILVLPTGTLQEIITSGTLYSNLSSIDLSNNNLIGFSIDAPNLIRLYLNNNPNLGNVNLGGYTNLTQLDLTHTGLTELDLTNNKEIEILYLGRTGNTTNNNDLRTTGIVGINECVKLKELQITRVGLPNETIELDNFPLLTTLYARGNNSGEGNCFDSLVFNSEIINNNLTYIICQKFTTDISQVIDFEFLPKLNTLTIFNTIGGAGTGVGFNLWLNNFHKLTGSFSSVNITSCRTDDVVVDLSNLNVTNKSLLSIRNIIGMVNIVLPNANIANVSIYKNTDLEEIVFNSSSKSIPRLDVFHNKLTSLDITNCNNLTTLMTGGVLNTFTEIIGFETKKTTLTSFHLEDTPTFRVDGELLDNFPNCTYLDLVGGELLYTVSNTWGVGNLRRICLRPTSATDGLATDGDQVSQLIRDVSIRSWTTSGQLQTQAVSTFGILDLRGNCATPTPSSALTTALNLLNSKGVTVLTN